MKNLSFLLILIISSNAFCSIDTIQTKSKITNVTVFLSGAQITRSANLKLTKGKHLLITDKLPQEINPQSIQVSGIDNCKILSVKHQLNYDNQNKKSTEQLDIEIKIDAQELKIKEIKNKLNVYELEEKLLLDNSNLAKKDVGSAISEIKEAADFYRIRLNEIRQGKLNLFTELEKADKAIQELYTKVNEQVSKRSKTYSQIMITVDCEKELSSDLNISYYISSAGWEPLYDFRVDDITKPLSIVYNANVYQSSGENWNNVKLKLSTNDPSLSGTKPELINWYVDKGDPYQKENTKKGPSTLKGRVLDNKTKEGLVFATVAVYRGNEFVTSNMTDLNGQYVIKPIQSGHYTIKISYLGYHSLQINRSIEPDNVAFQDFELAASSIALQELVEYSEPLITKNVNSVTATTAGVYQSENGKGLNIRGGRDNEKVYFIDGVRVIGSETLTTNYISNSLKTTVANLEYDIDIPYTIPSDGSDYSIRIKEVSLPVNYVYHAVPKLESDVFLTAQIKDWTQLSLLSGKSSIYYQGTFTGESYIDANKAEDTLSVSLGRDKNIIVTREGNKSIYDKKLIGNNIKETVGWDITIKNNTAAKIKIIVEDQFPLSEKKSIEIERLEFLNAKVEDRTGKLTWDLDLNSGEKKVLNYKYSVKYPKYSNLIIE